MAKVRVLEVTIRDGGYVLGHNYSRADVAVLADGISQAGFELIEIGHGNGMGCSLYSEPFLPGSLPSVGDLQHIEIAKKVAPNAQFGALFIPGDDFAPIEHLERLAAAGLSFIRFALIPHQTDESTQRYIRKAKELGFTISINLMQTYLLSPMQVTELASECADSGADWFYVVDSAGGMTGDMVKQYVAPLAELGRMEVGLHSHNNMGLGLANSLHALDAGATLFDSTLNGMGRSAGNPDTVQLVLALQQRGHLKEIQVGKLMGLGEAVRSVMGTAGNTPIDVVAGAGLIHSRNLPDVIRAADERGRDVCDYIHSVSALLEEASAESPDGAKSMFCDKLFDRAAESAKPVSVSASSPAAVDVVQEEMLKVLEADPKVTVEALFLRSQRHHKCSVLHISKEYALGTKALYWEGDGVVGVTVADFPSDFAFADGLRVPSYLVLEPGVSAPFAPRCKSFSLAHSDVLGRSVRSMVSAFRALGHSITCQDSETEKLRSMMCEANSVVGLSELVREDKPVAFLSLEDQRIDDLRAGDSVLCVGKAWSKEQVAKVREKGAATFTLDFAGEIAATVSTLIKLQNKLQQAMSVGEDTTLVPAPLAAASGQGVWDPDQGVIYSSDAVAEAARVYSTALLNGKIGF